MKQYFAIHPDFKSRLVAMHFMWFFCFLLSAVVFAGCSSDVQTSRKYGTEPSSGEKLRVGPRKIPPQQTQGESDQRIINKPGPQKRLASLPPKSQEEAIVEKLSGYKTAAEYFTITSRNFPEAVTAVTLPKGYYADPNKKYPLVIAFGGAGECAKTPRQGALAWLLYYKLDDAVAALGTSRLETENFRGLVSPAHLADFNRKLKKTPYRGVILACPSSPLLTAGGGPEQPDYEEFIMDELLPALKSRYRVIDDAVGVDGVSMGGARAMYYGLKYPEIFSTIGSSQGAFGPYMDLYAHLADRNESMLKKRPIQLVTSDKDVLAPHVERMHRMLSARNIPHSYLILTGPHDYIFNQGPGSISLLVFHDRALRSKNEF